MKLSAEKLDLILAKRGMLYKDLSRVTGMSEHTLRTIRRNEVKSRPVTIHRIANALGVEVEDLIDEEG